MSLAHFIDHTLLKNTATIEEAGQICREALTFGFAAACLPPYHIAQSARELQGSAVQLATVIGFPFGYHQYSVKEKEAIIAIEDGATELDMVINLAALKSGDFKTLEKEVSIVSKITTEHNRTLKIIIESGILSDEEIITLCKFYSDFPVQYLKTSTGYADKGASIHAVQLMREYLPASILIKASGGIRTTAFAQELIDAGASRLGCSASIAIVQGESLKGDNY